MSKWKTMISGITDSKKIKETYTASSAHTNITAPPVPYARTTQNFRLVWLDKNINAVSNADSSDSITKLQQVVNTVNTFTDANTCIDFIDGIKEEKVFVIFSGAFGQTTVPVVHDKPLVSTIHIFCKNKKWHEKWAKEWPKIKGVYTDISPICEELKQAAKECDQNSVSINFVKSVDAATNQNLDQLDQSFMYTQILKEILLTIDFQQVHINEFFTYCREQLAGNTTELKNVDKIEKEYRHHQPIWWYTYHSFLYSMLNRVLRMMEVDRIIKMGFFIRDLHHHIVELHSKQYDGRHSSDSFTVYRGQHLSQTDFDQLKETQGGLLSFNSFLSTSKKRHISLAFVQRTMATSGLVRVLFVITINPSVSATPFAKVGSVSYHRAEKEILFSMHSVFRIGQVKQIDENNGLWQVDLTLTSDNDPQLHALTEIMRKETFPHLKGWYRLGNLLVKLGQFDKAQQVFDIVLEQATEHGEKANVYYMLGMVNDNQGNYAEAIEFYESSIKINRIILPESHPDLATSYNNIGLVYYNMEEYSKALSYYEKALEISEKTLPLNHSSLATCYTYHGSVYVKMGEYLKALSYYETAHEIRQKTLPPNHPSLATSNTSHGSVYVKMGEYAKALSYYEKALEIRQKIFPPSHPSLATSYNNIGAVYYSMGKYSKALSYYEKDLEISQKTLSSSHPALTTSYICHGNVYAKMGEYSKALSYYEKALEISEKTLPLNHSSLATSHTCHGSIYIKTGEYSKALLYYEKALEISKETLPPDHPRLAASYNNIGLVYYNMGEYSTALSYYKKDLEISEKTLSVNHSDLATSYNNIALVYVKMNKYLKALSYYEKALEIYSETLPPNHPSLATSYNNIGLLYDKMGDYSKALLYHEKDLEISKDTLPPNHPDLLTSYNNVGLAYKNIGDFSRALFYYEKALEIRQNTLPSNHPDLASPYDDIDSLGHTSNCRTPSDPVVWL